MCKIEETIDLDANLHKEIIYNLIERFYDQAIVYVTIFRDGQDTIKRDFSFYRETKIKFGKITFQLSLSIPKDTASILKISINYTSDGALNRPFN